MSRIKDLVKVSTKLSYLNLGYCNIQVKGCFEILSAMKRNRILKTIILDGNDLRSESYQELTNSIMGNLCLTSLSLAEC